MSPHCCAADHGTRAVHVRAFAYSPPVAGAHHLGMKPRGRACHLCENVCEAPAAHGWLSQGSSRRAYPEGQGACTRPRAAQSLVLRAPRAGARAAPPLLFGPARRRRACARAQKGKAAAASAAGVGRGPTGVIKSVLDTSRAGGKARDEIFVDIVEKVSCTFSSSGYVQTSQIDGAIQARRPHPTLRPPAPPRPARAGPRPAAAPGVQRAHASRLGCLALHPPPQDGYVMPGPPYSALVQTRWEAGRGRSRLPGPCRPPRPCMRRPGSRAA